MQLESVKTVCEKKVGVYIKFGCRWRERRLIEM